MSKYTQAQIDAQVDVAYTEQVMDSQDYGISVVDVVKAGINWCTDEEYHGDMALHTLSVY